MKKAAIMIVACAMFGAYVADAACANKCSGRGRCGQDDKCNCFTGYGGPDCSERMCKKGVAWIGGSAADPHAYAECSNRGVCDRVNGLCTCDEGFEGAACERSACPNACSGHGQCEYIEELSSYDATNWAHHKIQGCLCDPGFEGEDCSKRMCPRGDDPLSIPDSNAGDTWTVSFTHDSTPAGDLAIQVTDLFGLTEISRPIDIADTDANIKTALEAMRAVKSLVSVTSSRTATTTEFEIVLQNPVRVNRIEAIVSDCAVAGCYPLRPTPLNPPVSTSASITLPADPALETDVCGNRGRCDSGSGRCTCYEGYYGNACEKQTVLV